MTSRCHSSPRVVPVSRRLSALALALFVALPACSSIGPASIARDRLDYDHKVTASWKRQMLLNLVKLRYGDAPLFLDVTSIINSYSLEGELALGAEWQNAGDPDSRSVGVSGRYADKPTITYSPMLGQRFTRSLMTPISPATVLSLIQAGWTPEGVLRSMVTSVNGVRNRFGFGARARPADPGFRPLIDALSRIQAAGGMGMRLIRTGEDEATLLTLVGRDEDPSIAADRAMVRSILGLEEGLGEYRVVYASASKDSGEVAMITRSMLEILLDVAAWAEVPAVDVADGRVLAGSHFENDEAERFRPLIRIHAGESAPEDAFTSVEYHGHAFWVDDRDYSSKSMFTMLLILFSLTDSDAGRNAPVVTIPAS